MIVVFLLQLFVAFIILGLILTAGLLFALVFIAVWFVQTGVRIARSVGASERARRKRLEAARHARPSG